VEDILICVQSKCNYIQRKAYDDLVGANLLLIELLSHFPLCKIDYKKVEGGRGDKEEGWVVEVGVTHTISEKNSDNSYSKKIFPNKFSAKLALKKHVIEMQKVIQLYVEDEPTDEEWRNSLKLHGKQRESRKGCGQPKT
jgi:hypothetical protein